MKKIIILMCLLLATSPVIAVPVDEYGEVVLNAFIDYLNNPQTSAVSAEVLKDMISAYQEALSDAVSDVDLSSGSAGSGYGDALGGMDCPVVTQCPDGSESAPPHCDCPTACPQDTKVCPDGSTVTRTGRDCKFPPCIVEDCTAYGTDFACGTKDEWKTNCGGNGTMLFGTRCEVGDSVSSTDPIKYCYTCSSNYTKVVDCEKLGRGYWCSLPGDTHKCPDTDMPLVTRKICESGGKRGFCATCKSGMDYCKQKFGDTAECIVGDEELKCGLNSKSITTKTACGCDGKCMYCSDTSTVCPEDIKECPDGSFVGRTPPKCEFAKCQSRPCPEIAMVCPDGTIPPMKDDCTFEPCVTADCTEDYGPGFKCGTLTAWNDECDGTGFFNELSKCGDTTSTEATRCYTCTDPYIKGDAGCQALHDGKGFCGRTSEVKEQCENGGTEYPKENCEQESSGGTASTGHCIVCK